MAEFPGILSKVIINNFNSLTRLRQFQELVLKVNQSIATIKNRQ